MNLLKEESIPEARSSVCYGSAEGQDQYIRKHHKLSIVLGLTSAGTWTLKKNFWGSLKLLSELMRLAGDSRQC